MTKDEIAKKLLSGSKVKLTSTMKYGSKHNTISISCCPVCGENHIDIQSFYDDKSCLCIKCPNTNMKVIGIYS